MNRYRALLRVPGARGPVVASALGSLPIGMYIIGILLLARDATGSFAEAGRVAAPALVAAIITLASPEAAVAAAGVLASGAALAFAATGASRRWRGEAHAGAWLGPLGAPGVRTVFVALAALGAAIGVVQVAVPAFTAAGGSAALGGVLLAALSAGSLAGGLVYGARTWPGRAATRLSLLLVALSAGCALLAAAGSNAALAVLLLAVGVILAPTTIVGSALLDVVAPAGTVTEAFTTMIMGIVAGNALGNALGGAIVDGPGYEASVLAASAIAGGGAALAYARRSTLGTRSARIARSS